MLTAQKSLMVAALLSSYDKDLVVVSFAGIANQLVFFQRKRERFLAKNVLARLEGLDSDFDVPVVGRDDADHVDIFAVQHFAVVAVDIRLALADAAIVLGPLRVPRVDVADGHDIAKPAVSLRVTRPHTAQPNAADNRPIVFFLVGKCFLSPGKIGNAAGRGYGGCCFQEITPIAFVRHIKLSVGGNGVGWGGVG